MLLLQNELEVLQATAAKLAETEEEKTRLTVRLDEPPGEGGCSECCSDDAHAARSFQVKVAMLDSHLKSQQAQIAKLHQQHAIETNQQTGPLQVRHWTKQGPAVFVTPLSGFLCC